MPRMRRQPKQRIAEPIPAWLVAWAERGVKTGDWGALYREPDFNPFILLAFTGIEDEIAEGLLRSVKRGEISVSEPAEISADAAEKLAARLSCSPCVRQTSIKE